MSVGKMVSFELGKEIEQDVFRLVTSVGQRKNSDSPLRTEVRFLTGTQKCCPTRVTRRKTYFSPF